VVEGDLAMEIGSQGRFADAENLLSQHTRFLLGAEEAKSVVSKMTEQVRSTWYEVARARGVSEKDAELINGAFVYEGFSR
jgi:serine/threonine-protein kinase HipA